MSEYFFTTETMKGRLVKTAENWYVGEWKPQDPPDSQWMPWIAGTPAWLGLSDQDVEWASKNYKPKKAK